ncbi:Myotubularin- protein 6 [Rhizophlyctis rosea]|uniref:Myotubularin- protein 6 n=1 Tax=Rhizophlyctis rosea TaxID=64517 RepID=A0AAD5X0G3_9FUNG|nr:Myotubularin- protein 6 [Rhizophlyctis rosea]
MGLSNIHVIAASYEALMKVGIYLPVHILRALGLDILLSMPEQAIQTSGDSPSWPSVLQNTNWLAHVAEILKAASDIVAKIVEGDSVLVHCSDGWDRTSQLVSLAQVLLDPYYRTLEGLRVLIEKEWLSFGHPFTARTHPTIPSPASEDASPKTIHKTIHSAASPIFILFLTCLHHIVEQHPTRFEYGDEVLRVLWGAACGYGWTGDFLGNDEYERNATRVRTRTYSIWKWIGRRRHRFVNPSYRRPQIVCSCGKRKVMFLGSGSSFLPLPPPCTPTHCCHKEWSKHSVLEVSYTPRHINLWMDMYFGPWEEETIADLARGMSWEWGVGIGSERDMEVRRKVEAVRRFVWMRRVGMLRVAVRDWRGVSDRRRGVVEEGEDGWVEVKERSRDVVVPVVTVVDEGKGVSVGRRKQGRGVLECSIEEAMSSSLDLVVM